MTQMTLFKSQEDWYYQEIQKKPVDKRTQCDRIFLDLYGHGFYPRVSNYIWRGRFGARLNDLRDRGFRIEIVGKGSRTGEFIYKLGEIK